MPLNFLRPRKAAERMDAPPEEPVQPQEMLETTDKTYWQRRLPVIACGAGLFADGYLNGVIGSVSTMLKRIYGKQYTGSSAQKNVSSITFAGTVLGIFIFGYTSDAFSRKWSLVVSTALVLLFSILATAADGIGVQGMFAALVAWRFLLGIGIGGEYPAGSVGCAEATGEVQSGVRNRWFIWFTNCTIDVGFVIAAAVPAIAVAIFGEDHLRAAWRFSLGIGIIPPLSLIWMRYKLGESEAFKRNNMVHAPVPWVLTLKYYWFRLACVSAIWFIYDFSSYAFGIYSSTIVGTVLGNETRLTIIFAWNILINFLYIPGAFLGSWASDWFGPRKALAFGVLAQAIVGFIMAACYVPLARPENIVGFVFVYGIFLSLGEFGPGDNIGLVAAKTCPTPVRARYYAIAAGLGKVGAFVGTYLFPIIEADAGSNPATQGQYAFWVASPLCVFAAFLAFFCLPEIGQDTIDAEDKKFREYLEGNGYNTKLMGFSRDNGSRSDVEYQTEEVPQEK